MNKIIKGSWHVNDYIDCGNYCEIILRNIKKIEVGRTKVDKKFLNKVLSRKWYLSINKNRKSEQRTVISVKRPLKRISLSQFILQIKKNFIIDHINGNTLDNRIENLRHVTYQQSNMNRRFKGFCFDNRIKKWVAYIHIKDKSIVRFFKTKKEAKQERLKMIKQYFKEFARL